MSANVIREERDTFRGIEVDDFDAERAEPVDAALEIAAFAGDDFLKAKLAYETAAIPAGSERSDHDEIAIAALAACVSKGVGFAVKRRVAKLHAAIVARANEDAVGVEYGGANWDATFGEALAGLRDGHGKKGGVVERLWHARDYT